MNIRDRKFLFVVGAPKCGTSSLVNWLGKHEEVFAAAVKEPGYFRDNADSYIIDAHYPDIKPKVSNSSAMVNFDTYLSLYRAARDSQWLVDGSTDYLSSEVTAHRLHRLAESNSVQIVCVLRDPIERAFSEHRHCIRDGFETLMFRQTIEQESERVKKGFQPLFFHVRRSQYYRDIKRYQELFGDHFTLMDFKDLNDSDVLTEKLYGKLGITVPASDRMPVMNASAEAETHGRFGQVKRLIRSALAPKNTREKTICFEDGALLFKLLRDDIHACLEDDTIPTASWTSMKFAPTTPERDQ